MELELRPLHPGRFLKEEMLDELNITPYRLAKDIGVDKMRVHRLIREEISVSVDTAMRLSTYFGNSVEFWLNLQRDYDLRVAQDQYRMIKESITPYDTAS